MISILIESLIEKSNFFFQFFFQFGARHGDRYGVEDVAGGGSMGGQDRSPGVLRAQA